MKGDAANAEHLKALVRAHADADDDLFYSVALQVAAKSARQGQGKFAVQLRELVEAAQKRQGRAGGRRTVTPVVQPRGELPTVDPALHSPKTTSAQATRHSHTR